MRSLPVRVAVVGLGALFGAAACSDSASLETTVAAPIAGVDDFKAALPTSEATTEQQVVGEGEFPSGSWRVEWARIPDGRRCFRIYTVPHGSGGGVSGVCGYRLPLEFGFVGDRPERIVFGFATGEAEKVIVHYVDGSTGDAALVPITGPANARAFAHQVRPLGIRRLTAVDGSGTEIASSTVPDS